MGESSASRLRGDSLTDVIFQRLGARKPVVAGDGRAGVRQQRGRVTGEYAAFAEISVKRMVSRDGQSQLLPQRRQVPPPRHHRPVPRHRPGPAQLLDHRAGHDLAVIEAKPEELRVYLEEAAGISKYKERRKETETRIRHTRENLDRLNDLREEVGQAAEHLKRQANSAPWTASCSACARSWRRKKPASNS
jgi:chromosome segregation protein